MKTKKYFPLVAFVFLFGMVGYSQKSPVDSLEYYSDILENEIPISNPSRVYGLFYAEKERCLEAGAEYFARAIFDLDNMSLIEYRQGLYYNSENTAVEALKLLDSLPQSSNNDSWRYRLINRIGFIKWEFDDYKAALNYHKTLMLYLKDSLLSAASLYNNIGVDYKYLKKYDSAKIFLEKSYQINKKIDTSKIRLARSLDNLGFVMAMQDEKEGLDFMMESLNIRKSKGAGLFISYDHLTEFYLLQENKKKALFYAKQAYRSAVQNKSEPDLLKALRNLIKLGEQKYNSEYFDLDEKIKRNNNLNENKFAKIKYDYSKSELKAAREKAKAERTQLIYSSIAGFTLLFSFSLFLIIRARHKKKILVQQFETEQYISKKLHDEVANDVFHTITKVRGNKTNQPELLDALDEIYHKVRDISKSNADLDVTKDFARLLNDLIVNYKTEQVNIFTKNASKMIWTELSEVKRKMLYRVLQELMVNMKKHSQATLVTLNFEQDKGKLKVQYVDNGVGCSLEKGSGLTNTESRMEMIGGKITFESEIGKGFRAYLIL
jgi:anti-sigma regulatory factor (Ser/Thr protein kinase)